MLKLSISARFSTGTKLSWKADADVGEGRKQENRFTGERERGRGEEGGGVSMGIRNGKFFSFSQLG